MIEIAREVGSVLWGVYVVGGVLWALFTACMWLFSPGMRENTVREARAKVNARFPGEGHSVPLWPAAAITVVGNTVLWPWPASGLVRL